METQKRRIKTAIVILNWNGKDWLEKFLPTIIQHSDTAEIIIADNGSTDDSLLFLSKNFPNIKVINNKENLGFAGGYNNALDRIHAEYYVLLNPDVEVSDNWLLPIISLMDKDKDIVVENLSEQLLVELKRIRLLLVVIVFVLIVGSIL